jgi:hypothetical protein
VKNVNTEFDENLSRQRERDHFNIRRSSFCFVTIILKAPDNPSSEVSHIDIVSLTTEKFLTSHITLDWSAKTVAWPYTSTSNPTPWSRVLPEKIIFNQILRKFLEFQGILWFTAVFARHHL